MDLMELQTPCLILDSQKLERNLASMSNRVRSLGVQLRPHGKTAKNIKIVRMAMAGQAECVTTSTLKEAEYFFENGIKDIVYAVGSVPSKLDRAAMLINKGARLTLVLDSLEQARHVSTSGIQHNIAISVLIEVDCDGHRSGVAPDDACLLEIGQFAHQAKGITLAGVLTHGGESYLCTSSDAIRAIAKKERDAAVHSAARLRDHGIPCFMVSVGSTPTAIFADNLSGVTELRAGVYMFYDLVMAGLNVCTLDEIALSVLVTVIGHQKQKGWIITDGGWASLSRDRGTAAQKVDQGYGIVCNPAGTPISELIVSSASQEHGIVSQRMGHSIDWDAFPIGAALRILPNHACATATMHDEYYVVGEGTEVVDRLDRVRGW